MLEELFYAINAYFLLGNMNNLSYYATKLKRKNSNRNDTKSIEDTTHSYDPNFISILIPTFDEANVIGRTIENFMEVNYPKDAYDIIIATYETDYKTREIVKRYKKLYPNVREIVNPEKPPTTKAQNLNYAYQFINGKTKIIGFHDAEDIVSKNILRDANYWLNNGLSTVQFKVIPERRGSSLTERSYALSFGKNYNLILPAKERLRRLISSAGVGTYIKKDVLDEIKRLDGYLFDEGNLTEDFELSLRLAIHGYKIKYINTSTIREKFPDKFLKAVRQRSRWALGGIQTLEKHRLGKNLKFSEKVGLMLDYLSLGSPVWGIATGISLVSILGGMANYIPQISPGSPLWFLSLVNTVGALEEILVSPYYTSKEYGRSLVEYVKDSSAIIVNDIINCVAWSKAFLKYTKSKLRGEKPEWEKTSREVPDPNPQPPRGPYAAF